MKNNLRAYLSVLSLVTLLAFVADTDGQDRRRGRNNSEHIRNHAQVRTAFTNVVTAPRKSTAVVFSMDKRVALGTIVDAEGLILTKASELGKSLECELPGGKRLAAKVIGIHQPTDLAMLKVESQGLSVVEWQDGDPPIVGSFLATPGVTDIPRAIGVVSHVPRKIPSPPGILGILLDEDEKGPRIDQVIPDSAAERAGLQVNDIVVTVNTKEVQKRDELINFVRRFKAGDKLELTILRGDERKKVPATLGSRMDLTPEGRRGVFQNTLGGPLSKRRSGFPSAIQHDTVLRPQDCGGPIVNLDGKAIGINIARSGRVDSMALPVSIVKPLIQEMKDGKHKPVKTSSE